MDFSVRERCASISPPVAIAALAALVTIVVGIGTIFQWWIVRDPGQAAGAVEGKVRKAGRQPWHDIEGAWPGTLLEYHLTARNSGGRELNHPVLTLGIPHGVRVLPETCRVVVDSRESRCPRGWLGGGVSRRSLAPSDGFGLIVQAQLRRGVGSAFQTVDVELNADETRPESDEVKVKPRATHAQAAARSLVRGVDGRGALEWNATPQPAIRSERRLAHSWALLNPERRHRFDAIPPDQIVSVDRLVHDRRLDGRIVSFAGTIGGDPTTYAAYRPRSDGEPGQRLALQRFVVESESGDGQASCLTTRLVGHRLHEGDRVRVRAMPIAWGSIESADGVVPAVSLDCAAIQRLPSPPQDGPSESAPAIAGSKPCE